MGEEFYCILKVISGEEILSLICVDENDGDPIILLHNPVVIKTIQNQNGSFIKIKPWIEMSEDDIFAIKFDKIITMTETQNNNLIILYQNYLSKDNEENYIVENKVSISNNMGYISSVEEARNKLEKIFKGTKES
jgi:hypothetical protein